MPTTKLDVSALEKITMSYVLPMVSAIIDRCANEAAEKARQEVLACMGEWGVKVIEMGRAVKDETGVTIVFLEKVL